MKICLDTNVYAEIKRGADKEVVRLIEEADTVYVPAIVVGELFAGFYQGRQVHKNLSELKNFFEVPGVEFAPPSIAICERYGLLVAELRRAGRPIPTNDIWIAATALETGSRLLSYDKHFDAIQGLFVYAP
jgi:tRNA(fMet)-specific endonuclease VapC